ncbi:hypothetical protein [Nitrobacter winogradskyi]|uniref:Uncharacterized protein n=2 Tax=Nitrobacter winogradskyi TaxID=913 RepID=A0ACC6AGX6_NITWI|nr:hypothetical protein [Nitrobacter winogradskyi]MCP1998998.1 hypothetical protein [Nitrobacter winogradskyi]GEC16484.1 hypothetical protein NWI01_23760 [Nitrobacter winogradskyi]
MKRLVLFLLFVPAAMLTSGMFGALHDQISYSVSSEYFTKFKFLQFHLLNPDIPERARVFTVGFLASWWMGLPLGVLCGLAGMIHRRPALMWRSHMLSLCVAVVTTLVTVLVGLGYGWEQTRDINIAAYSGWFIPQNVTDLRRFLCAGYMHNAAYIGGVLSVASVWIFNIAFRVATKDQSESSDSVRVLVD